MDIVSIYKSNIPIIIIRSTYCNGLYFLFEFAVWWLRYCRNYAHKTQKRPCMDAGARRTAPRKARFDGFVKHRTLSSIISYSILATQRSDGRSTCSPVVPGAYVPHYYINVLNKVFNAFC